MAYFDRFDICEAHLAMEWDYNSGGVLWERESNSRRMMSTGYQLGRMHFSHGVGFNGFDSLTENGQEIYQELEDRYGFSHSRD